MMTEKPETVSAKTLLNSIGNISQALCLALVIWIVNTLYQVDKTVGNHSWQLERVEKRLDSMDRTIKEEK